MRFRFWKRNKKQELTSEQKLVILLLADIMMDGPISSMMTAPEVESWPVNVTDGQWTFRGYFRARKGDEFFQTIERDIQDWDMLKLRLYDTETHELVEEGILYFVGDRKNLEAFFDLSEPIYMAFEEAET